MEEEKICYLVDCVKDREGQSLLSSGYLSGASFDDLVGDSASDL